jgi:hypothetical protein
LLAAAFALRDAGVLLLIKIFITVVVAVVTTRLGSHCCSSSN